MKNIGTFKSVASAVSSIDRLDLGGVPSAQVKQALSAALYAGGQARNPGRVQSIVRRTPEPTARTRSRGCARVQVTYTFGECGETISFWAIA